MRDVVVVGAGISGLSFAHYCATAGLDVLVLEQRSVTGGCIQSWRQPEGFWTELGAHTCYNSYGAIIAILEERGAMGKLLPRDKEARFRLLVGDEVVPFYKPLHWGELLLSAPRMLFVKKQGRTVRQYYEAALGRRNYDDVLGPMFTGAMSQPAHDFPADMVFKTRARRKDVLRSFTLEGGLSTLADVMAATPRVSVRTGATVAAVEPGAQGFVVRQDGAEPEAARFVALATPPTAAARLAAAVSPAAAALMSRISTATVDTLGVVAEAAAVRVGKAAGIIPVDGRFHSVVTRDPVPDPRFRGFAVHDKPGASLDDRKRQAATVLGVAPDSLGRVTRRQVELTAPHLGHQALVTELEGALAGKGLFVTGNYFAGLSLEDCVQRSFAEATRLAAMR